MRECYAAGELAFLLSSIVLGTVAGLLGPSWRVGIRGTGTHGQLLAFASSCSVTT